MQVLDESRHFLREVQFAQGDWLASIDPKTNLGGGVLPDAVLDFVRQSLNTNFLQGEESLRSIKARLNGLDRLSASEPPLSSTRFGVFPTPSIYPPALYVPQILAIEAAKLFSNKVYVWFYCARVFNAVTCVLLIFFALLAIGPQRSAVLMIPAVLPMSLYQLGSASSDAAIIALSIVFVALCVRFWRVEGATIRLLLVICLALLVLGKPVHLAFALLLLTAYKRLGWRRAASFCCVASIIACAGYLSWSYFVRRFLALAGEGNGQNPPAQIEFVIAHPMSFARILLVTVHHEGFRMAKEVIGMFGWAELPLPRWFEWASFLIVASIVVLVVINCRKVSFPKVILGFFTIGGLVLAVFLAGYVLWNRPAAPAVSLIQGRYFIPALAVLAALTPSMMRLGAISSRTLLGLCTAFLLLSTLGTFRTANHYYFPRSELLGRNMHDLFQEVTGSSCPASVEYHGRLGTWFEFIETGRTFGKGNYRVLFATDNGIILSESDPALIGEISPYRLISHSPGSEWRIHIWRQNRAVSGHLWLVRGGQACAFGPTFVFRPYEIPDAQSFAVPHTPDVILQ